MPLRSRFVAGGEVSAAWGPDAQQALRDLFLAQTQGMLHTYPEDVYIASPLNMFGSENIDSSGQVRTQQTPVARSPVAPYHLSSPHM